MEKIMPFVKMLLLSRDTKKMGFKAHNIEI